VNDAAEWVTAETLAAAARGELPSPRALVVLVRQYASSGRADIRDALEPALAQALERAAQAPDTSARLEWLGLLVEAAAFSEDERVQAAAVSLAADLAAEWPSAGTVEQGMRSVAGLFSAAMLLGPPHGDETIARGVDELERMVSVAYQPGSGIGHGASSQPRQAGELADHVAAADALLTAFEITGRLPYSMLAEELMQFTRRVWWDDERGAFRGSFGDNCDAARVLCRLAALHQDRDYVAAAVIAEGTDYAGDAARALRSLAADYRTHGVDAARYAIALGDLAAYDKIHPSL
jgi:hypothetical protein